MDAVVPQSTRVSVTLTSPGPPVFLLPIPFLLTLPLTQGSCVVRAKEDGRGSGGGPVSSFASVTDQPCVLASVAADFIF